MPSNPIVQSCCRLVPGDLGNEDMPGCTTTPSQPQRRSSSAVGVLRYNNSHMGIQLIFLSVVYILNNRYIFGTRRNGVKTLFPKIKCISGREFYMACWQTKRVILIRCCIQKYGGLLRTHWNCSCLLAACTWSWIGHQVSKYMKLLKGKWNLT